MKHIVYKTTNLINNKIYIGIHSTENEFDYYFGSGRVFLKALKKYGKNNFKKEILFVFKNRIEALEKEKELVNEDFILCNTNYNCTIGGYGGIGISNKGRKHTLEAIEKIRLASKRKCKEETKVKISLSNKNKKRKEEHILKNSLLRKEYYKINNSPRLGIKCSEETKNKISNGIKKYYETNTSKKLGIKLSEETKKKMSESNNRRKVLNKITLETYLCGANAIKLLKISSRTFYRNINKENYFLRYE